MTTSVTETGEFIIPAWMRWADGSRRLQLLGQRCNACGVTFFPRTACFKACGSAEVGEVALGPECELHAITVDFFNAGGGLIESATPLKIYVDNNPCSVSLSMAAIGSNSATTDCGYLQYSPASKATDHVTIAYAAGHPEGFATWSFSLIKSATPVPGAAAGGAVPSGPAYTSTVGTLLGTCTVAAFSASVYVAATANTGWSRCSQYDRSAWEAFPLAP